MVDRSVFLSDEEYLIACWLEKLQQEGYVMSYSYEPESFQLCDSNEIEYTLEFDKKRKKPRTKKIRLNPSLIYTTDFKVEWNEEMSKGTLTIREGQSSTVAPLFALKGQNISYLEVKPGFDRNNMTREAKLKLAWVMQKYDVAIQIVVPEKLFENSFYPDEYFVTKNGKSKMKRVGDKLVEAKEVLDYNTFEDFIKNKTNKDDRHGVECGDVQNCDKE